MEKMGKTSSIGRSSENETSPMIRSIGSSIRFTQVAYPPIAAALSFLNRYIDAGMQPRLDLRRAAHLIWPCSVRAIRHPETKVGPAIVKAWIACQKLIDFSFSAETHTTNSIIVTFHCLSSRMFGRTSQQHKQSAMSWRQRRNSSNAASL